MEKKIQEIIAAVGVFTFFVFFFALYAMSPSAAPQTDDVVNFTPPDAMSTVFAIFAIFFFISALDSCRKWLPSSFPRGLRLFCGGGLMLGCFFFGSLTPTYTTVYEEVRGGQVGLTVVVDGRARRFAPIAKMPGGREALQAFSHARVGRALTSDDARRIGDKACIRGYLFEIPPIERQHPIRLMLEEGIPTIRPQTCRVK